MGRHVNHSDTSNLAFLLSDREQNNTTYLVPASICEVWEPSVMRKMARRDQRTDPNKLDFINYNC